MTGGVVVAVEPGSIAATLGIRSGDVLLQVNGHPLRDVLDVQFYAAEEAIDLLVRRGEQEIEYQIEREYGIPLGLDFASPTFDGIRRCDNRCEFCFVTQMPPGLRRSLYVRDDDYRYSVLYGNFITLTHLTTDDWERLAEQRLSPLYVSVHATNAALRRRLLGREDVPDILPQLDRLAALGIAVHAQIVLIPGMNDGPHLTRTITDLVDRYPAILSIGIVPVGLTRYHRGPCRRYTPDEAEAILKQVVPVQAACRARYGLSTVYLADEWYLLAGVDVPADEAYDGYPQIENGIGLVRQFLDDSLRFQASAHRARAKRQTSVSLVCGTLIAPMMRQVVRDLAASSGLRMVVVPVVNQFFGETVTVSGLLSGQDVLATLCGCDLGEIVFLPGAMFAERPAQRGTRSLESGENEVSRVTLDDWTLERLSERLDRRVVTANWMSEVWDELTI
jgi:putative radical SAM enzyme (TIGR03279 family)